MMKAALELYIHGYPRRAHDLAVSSPYFSLICVYFYSLPSAEIIIAQIL